MDNYELFEHNQRLSDNYESIRNTKDNILKNVLINIFSSCFNLICICLIETINLIIMGWTNNANKNVDSVGLGNLYLNFIGVLLGFGILGGLDTMGSNSYGSGKYRLLGIYTIRSRIIIIVLFFLITVPMGFFSFNILSYLNIRNDLAYSSCYYIINMLPAVFFTFLFNTNIRYLQVMHVYFIPSLITISASFIHFILCYTLIILYEMDLKGLCISSNITMLYCFLFSCIYINNFNPCPESYFFYSDEIWKKNEFINYVKLSIFSGIQHYGDYIGYEVVCFMCSYLSESSMAATLIVLNYANLIGYIYVGFSFPLSHMVGLYMGEKDFYMYKYIVKIFTYINTITAGILGIFTFYFSDSISQVYIINESTNIKAELILKYWTIGVTSDIYNIMYQAILRGAGKQAKISVWNLVMSLLWMIPVSYILCFKLNMDVLGIWIGCISYVIILTLINVYYFLTLDIVNAASLIEKELNNNKLD